MICTNQEGKTHTQSLKDHIIVGNMLLNEVAGWCTPLVIMFCAIPPFDHENMQPNPMLLIEDRDDTSKPIVYTRTISDDIDVDLVLRLPCIFSEIGYDVVVAKISTGVYTLDEKARFFGKKSLYTKDNAKIRCFEINRDFWSFII